MLNEVRRKRGGRRPKETWAGSDGRELKRGRKRGRAEKKTV